MQKFSLFARGFLFPLVKDRVCTGGEERDGRVYIS